MPIALYIMARDATMDTVEVSLLVYQLDYSA